MQELFSFIFTPSTALISLAFKAGRSNQAAQPMSAAFTVLEKAGIVGASLTADLFVRRQCGALGSVHGVALSTASAASLRACKMRLDK